MPQKSTKSSKLTKKNVKAFGNDKNLYRNAEFVINADELAVVSQEATECILDKPEAEIQPGVFLAPIMRGSWGACAQVQVEANCSYGPYINTAESLICRVFACSKDGLQIEICGQKYRAKQGAFQ